MQHYSPISQLRDNILTALARTPESTPYCTLLLSSFVFFRRLLLTGGKRRRRTSQASEFVMQVREERRGPKKIASREIEERLGAPAVRESCVYGVLRTECATGCPSLEVAMREVMSCRRIPLSRVYSSATGSCSIASVLYVGCSLESVGWKRYIFSPHCVINYSSVTSSLCQLSSFVFSFSL